MNIEIVEFYPIEESKEKQFVTGTLHIYIVDFDLDIRGVFVSKKKDCWFFGLPKRMSIDEETGKKIHYPIISFTNRDRHRELIDAIRKKGIEFISNKLVQMSLI